MAQRSGALTQAQFAEIVRSLDEDFEAEDRYAGCPLCGYGAWWGTCEKNEAGEMVIRKDQTVKTAKVVRWVLEHAGIKIKEAARGEG